MVDLNCVENAWQAYLWKKCGLEGVIENEMTDRLADKLQNKNQIYPNDDWILKVLP